MRYSTRARGRRIVAEDEVTVAPEATELLFEAEDVAELVAEVTGEVVEVTADGEDVTFAIGSGDDAEEFTVSAEGDEEVLESVRRPLRGKSSVAAARRSARRPSARPVKASRTIRKVPSTKR